MTATRVTRALAYAWVALLSLLVIGPALLPGFVLSYDLVFTPQQVLLPGSIGVGSGLPRAVPQDAVVALVETVVPGMLVEKLVLLAIPLLAGTGMLRLLRGTAAGVVGATLAMYPAPESHGGMGNFIAWDAGTGKIVWSNPEQFSVWSGALTTAGDVVFYGTLEGYLKAVRLSDGKELWKFKTPSGIIGNVFTYEHKGKQYVGVYSGIGGWAGIGMAAGLEKDSDGLGAVGGYRDLQKFTNLGGSLTVFAIP